MILRLTHKMLLLIQPIHLKFNQDLLLTWGVDGKVCVWDSTSKGMVTSSMCRLVSNPNYPVYALDYTRSKESSDSRSCLAIAGGSEGGFVGVPLHMYDI